MTRPTKTYPHTLAVGLAVLSSCTNLVLAGDVGSPWGDSFPLKQTSEDAAVRQDSHRNGPPASDLHLIERETEVRREQIDPLHAVVRIIFPKPEIITIGDAVTALLKPMGYALLDGGGNTSELLRDLLASPLPEVQRRFHDVRASEVLRALAGVGYITVVDHIRRRVTFDPIPLYLAIGGNTVSDARRAGQGDINSQNSDERLLRKPLVPVQPDGQGEAPSSASDAKRAGQGVAKYLTTDDRFLRKPLDPVQSDGWAEVPSSAPDVKEGVDSTSSLAGAPVKSDATFRARVLAKIEKVPARETKPSVVTRRAKAGVVDTLVKTVTISREEAIARETELRMVADQFLNDSDVITITSCVPEDDSGSVERHQARLFSALVRLGVLSQAVRQITPACGSTDEAPRSGMSRVVLTRSETHATNQNQ